MAKLWPASGWQRTWRDGGLESFLRLHGPTPQPRAGDRGALAERAQLGPDDALGHHRLAAHCRSEAAIDAGDQALAVHERGVAADALRHQPRMLDEIRRGVDDARNENLHQSCWTRQ